MLTVTLLFLCLNFIAYIGFQFRTIIKDYLGGVNPIYEKYGEAIHKAYPGWKKLDVSDLLNETWSRPLVYESITQFRERPFNGKFVNVDEAGFRRGKNQGPWPPDTESVNVFVFGGSTTFGYGLPDEQTLSSYLQAHLMKCLKKPVHVYNFGRGYYYSTQELLLFEKLILNGFLPDICIFVDGLNEFFYAGESDLLWSSTLKRCTDRAMVTQIRSIFSSMPLHKAIQWLMKRVFNVDNDATHQARKKVHLQKFEADNIQVIGSAIDRYQRNKKMIDGLASTYNIRTVFVWQPVPVYKLEPTSRVFSGSHLGKHELSGIGYEETEKRFKQSEFGSNFLWCADIQEDVTDTLYVDTVHYSALMCNRLAGYIVALSEKKGLLTEH
jgi:hypothetical protein